MNNYLPVMILKGLVLLPNQEVKIELNNNLSENILKLAKKHHNGNMLIVCPKDQLEEVPEVNDLPTIGVVGNLKSKIILPNGNVRITIMGINRVSVNQYKNLEDDKSLLMADVTNIELPKFDIVEETAIRRKLIEILTKYINSSHGISNALLSSINSITDLYKLTDIIASFMPFGIEKKINYMEEVNALHRANALIYDISVELEVLDLDQKIDDALRIELENNQKEFILREKLDQIKKELGETNEHDKEVSDYLEVANSLKCDVKTKNKIINEINKFDYTPDGSPEASVIRNYLDLVLNLPWNKFSNDEDNLSKIRKNLDKGHYGLDKAKDRILEYTAVKKRNANLKSPIICLVGPPGVGKTSFGISIAKALHKEFYKISVGGLNDTAELVGHRRTYIGSSPGKIIQAINKCGVANPLILIDEIDKMVKDFRGDPASALLDILDPEQNSMYIDNYVEEPFDLSKVMFILTANDSSSIPSALYDRLEIIELSSYTEYEKIDIAKKYLLPNIFKEHVVSNKNIKFSDEILLNIIEDYTRESGLRELSRLLSMVVRKIITDNEDQELKVNVNKDLIKKYLGRAKYAFNNGSKTLRPGLVNGLAYTPMGGLVMPIEACMYEGHGKVITTGMLGQSMSESISVALSYIRSNKEMFKVNDYYFDQRDIHLHALEGAIPKDGPSAGVAITTTILSLVLKKIIPSDVAMTGEISLRGDILEIGGLKEKILGAYKDHVKTVFIPLTNVADLDDIPLNVREAMDIVPVSNYLEIFQSLFN